MTDAEFLAAFEGGRIAPGDFHHRDHVRLAWACLRREALVPGIARFVVALKRFAAAAGKPTLYHETVTLAYLLLIHDRMSSEAPPGDFESFAARNEDLFARDPWILDRYYQAETLRSERARTSFVWPDRASAVTPRGDGTDTGTSTASAR
jgi:hypothetical protein